MARRHVGGRHNKTRKNRKWGRNKVKCSRYRAEGRRERNKARRAAKRLRGFRKR